MQERIWLLTVEALDENNIPTTLRFSSGDYTDDLGNYYDLRIKQPALFTTSAFAGSVLQTGSRVAIGETVLINADGELNYLADYAVDGREAILSLLDEFGVITVILRGTVSNLQFENLTVGVRLRDPQAEFDLEFPQNEYLGNNIPPDGLEGTEDSIKGTLKPQCFGSVRSITPVLVNPQKLIYEAHDLSSNPSVDVEVVAVYDKGVLITKHSHQSTLFDFLNVTVPAGQYTTYEGYFRLHTPPVGQVTCDVDSTLNLLGDVFENLMGLVGKTVEPSDVTFLNTFGVAGYYLKQKTNTSKILDLIAQSIGGYWYFDLTGNVRVKQLENPSTPTVEIFDYEIGQVSRSKTGAGSNGVPIHKVKLKYDKIETVQNDLADSVDDNYRARVSVAFREAISESPATKTRHPLSEEIVIETLLTDATEAQFQADRLVSLLSVRRDFVSCTVRLDAATSQLLEIGQDIKLNTYKLGYDLGKNFTLIGYTLDARLSRAELSLFG